MKPRATWIIPALLMVSIGIGLALQRRSLHVLGGEVERLRERVGALEAVDSENRRLRQLQPSPAALAHLRADHQVIAGLRAELEKLRRGEASTKR